MDRIVSLVPSLTELVFWLGAGDRMVGRTRFCDVPAGLVRGVPVIGGTKNPDLARIIAARPHLVLANREENRQEDVEALQAAGLQVLVTDPNTVLEAATMVEDIGALVGATVQARTLADETRAEANVAPGARRPHVFAAVWLSPLMGLGSASYGHSVLEASGAENVLAHRPRYPELTMDELAGLDPGIILLPDEPYPFKAHHVPAFSAVAPTRVIDGRLLWWYGPRMPASIRELRRLINEAV